MKVEITAIITAQVVVIKSINWLFKQLFWYKCNDFSIIRQIVHSSVILLQKQRFESWKH